MQGSSRGHTRTTPSMRCARKDCDKNKFESSRSTIRLPEISPIFWLHVCSDVTRGKRGCLEGEGVVEGGGKERDSMRRKSRLYRTSGVDQWGGEGEQGPWISDYGRLVRRKKVRRPRVRASTQSATKSFIFTSSLLLTSSTPQVCAARWSQSMNWHAAASKRIGVNVRCFFIPFHLLCCACFCHFTSSP